MSATDGDDDAAVVEDRRLPAWWYYTGAAVVVASAVVAFRVHLALLVLAFVLLVLLEVLRRRAGYTYFTATQSAIALKAPLPGTWWPRFVALLLMILAMQFVGGSLGPGEVLPTWAAAILAVTAGVTFALLWRRSDQAELVVVRRWERDRRSDDTGARGPSPDDGAEDRPPE
ncbi:hypothetical protein GCM10023169_12770 [Georgenia halophila]|uniref:Uncharacterized protein n=1 Tax=Georgenia halophila TaxID=620889 RepID=A0ABP8KW04_9MICO